MRDAETTTRFKLTRKPDRANTFSGHRERCNVILHKELYAGVISYNRQSFVRDPMTRKRVARPNPREQWITTAVPVLAIIDQQSLAATTVRRRGRSAAGTPETPQTLAEQACPMRFVWWYLHDHRTRPMGMRHAP